MYCIIGQALFINYVNSSVYMNCIIGQELFIKICLEQCMYELYNRPSSVNKNMFRAVYV